MHIIMKDGLQMEGGWEWIMKYEMELSDEKWLTIKIS